MANKTLNSITFPGLSPAYVNENNAAEFSSSTSYAVGSYCIYLGQLYRCTTAHSGAWDASDFTAVYLADEVQSANAAIDTAESDIDSLESRMDTAESDIDSAESNIEQSDIYFKLTAENIPGETQTVNFDSDGNVSTITHVVSGTTVRTDTFTFESSTITEVRVLNTGESLTLVTNTSTLVTTTTYSDS